MNRDLKAVFIIGYPRSGSTILGNILGEVEGFFHAGELAYLWRRYSSGKGRCGCLRDTWQCELWSEVLSDGLGTRAVLENALRLKKQAINSWHLPELLGLHPGRTASLDAIDAYTDLLGQLYRRISEVTGANVIIDSSKWPADAAAVGLLQQRGIAPHFIHLIRDPRGVVYSRQTGNKKPTAPGTIATRRTLVAYDAIGWTASNMAAELVARRTGVGRSARVIYEDFTARPRDVINRVCRIVEEEPRRLPFRGDTTVWLKPNHCLLGNRSRFKSGEIEIRERAEWVSRLSRVDRSLIVSLTFPLMRRYGYRRRFTNTPGARVDIA